MARPQKNEKVYIYGKHALEEALAGNPAVIKKVYLAPELRDHELAEMLATHKIPTDLLKNGNEMAGRDAVHQGVVALMEPGKLLTQFDDFIESLEVSEDTAIAVLGEVQDPHNVGAIIRSAAAFGLSAVLIPERNQAPITGAVVKSSAGMAFRIPLVSIGNVNHALEVLKKKGFWTYGLDMEGQALGNEGFEKPSAFVIGNEGAGIREKTLAACDITLAIPMHPRTESLNAAASAGIVFYEWSKKHPASLSTPSA
ncbi:MAG TPA: 23S rRNA (guanosine(2251)-2'-O)-methyltransferase RlmB [Candidatus Paceibacterota bacterium]|nr:23S rRNA (guanosine(2251)-2'-O)-methyltransferase RlmB [Candidatus Paceibacterota bacterium]